MSISTSVMPSHAARASSAIANAYLSATAAAKSAAVADGKPSDNTSTVVTLSNRALELMQRRQVSDTEAQTFKNILADAANAEDPKAFLQGLSSAEMEVLRKVHTLADPINISSLTNEGAANLLAQPGSAQDLDNDGLTAVGAGYSMTFPPQNAPESFKTAWASATAGMSEFEIPTHMIFAVGLANIGLEPGDPKWRNPYADPNYDYKGAIDDIMSSLKYQFEHNMIPQQQYQRFQAFYSRLSSAMG